jgi:hypothetical protein
MITAFFLVVVDGAGKMEHCQKATGLATRQRLPELKLGGQLYKREARPGLKAGRALMCSGVQGKTPPY